MFTRDELSKYADVLIWGLSKARKTPYADGDLVLVRYDQDALPLAEVLWDKLLEKGLLPVQRFNLTPTMEVAFYSKAGDSQLTTVPPGDKELFENLNGLISLISPASLTHLAGVDSKRIGKALVARKFLREIMEKREDAGKLGWTLCALPTAALAEAAGLSLEEYKAEIVRACFLDTDDPVAEWEAIYESAQEAKTKLNTLEIESLRVVSENIDLVVTPGERRQWLGLSGHNIPSFEIFTSPDWRGVEGVYYADQPSYRSGNLVQGVRLVFEKGEVVESDAQKGADFVKGQLAMDEGARRVGEFSLTDRRFSRISRFMANTLYDENYGGDQGNCHIAVGAAYSETFAGELSELTRERKKELGYNDSALHWDLVNTEKKTVTATMKDGSTRTLYENGEFAGV